MIDGPLMLMANVEDEPVMQEIVEMVDIADVAKVYEINEKILHEDEHSSPWGLDISYIDSDGIEQGWIDGCREWRSSGDNILFIDNDGEVMDYPRKISAYNKIKVNKLDPDVITNDDDYAKGWANIIYEDKRKVITTDQAMEYTINIANRL